MSVNVVSPDGQTWAVDETEAKRLASHGYTPETSEQAQARADKSKYSDRPLAAGAAALLRGATLGGSDVVGDVFGKGLGIDEGTLGGLQKYNSGVSTVGELAGAVAPAFIPGVGEYTAAGLATKAGTAAEGVARGALGEGLAARALTSAARVSTEASLYGAGHAVSESVLDDSELTAEKLLSGAGTAFLGGAAFGAGGSILGEGASRVAEKLLGEQTLPEALASFAEKRADKATGAMLKDFRGLNYQGKINEVGRDAIDQGIITPFASYEDIAKRANTKLEEQAAKLDGFITKLDRNTATPGDKLNQLVKGLEAHVEGGAPSTPELEHDTEDVLKYLSEAGPAAEHRIKASDVAERINKEIIDPLRGTVAYQKSVIPKLEAEAEQWEAMGDKRLSFVEAEQQKRGYDDFLDQTQKGSPFEQQRKRIRWIIKDEIEQKAQAVGDAIQEPKLAAEYKEAKRLYGSFSEMYDTASDRYLRQLSNRTTSPSDYAMGAVAAMMHGGPAGLVTGAAGALANRAVRLYGNNWLALGADKLATKLADSPAYATIAKAFSGAVEGQLQSNPAAFGAFSSALADAAAQGADKLLATHVMLARTDPAYRGVMAKAGYPAESPAQTQQQLEQAGQLAHIRGVVDAHDKRIDAALSRFVGKQGGASPTHEGPPEGRKARLASYQKQLDALASLTANPQQLAKSIQPNSMLTNSAPTVAGIAATKAAQVAQYLQQVAPKNPHNDVMKALSVPWQPTDAQLASWGRTLRAVNDPASLLSDLRSGSVSTEAVMAMKAVYPKLLDDIRARMTEKLSTLDKPLTYHQRQALSTLMEAPVGEANMPSRTAVFQQAHNAARQAKAANASRSTPQLAESPLATMSQKVEGR